MIGNKRYVHGPKLPGVSYPTTGGSFPPPPGSPSGFKADPTITAVMGDARSDTVGMTEADIAVTVGPYSRDLFNELTSIYVVFTPVEHGGFAVPEDYIKAGLTQGKIDTTGQFTGFNGVVHVLGITPGRYDVCTLLEFTGDPEPLTAGVVVPVPPGSPIPVPVTVVSPPIIPLPTPTTTVPVAPLQAPAPGAYIPPVAPQGPGPG